MGILSGPVFGVDQLIDLLLPVIAGGLILVGMAVVWFAIGLVVK